MINFLEKEKCCGCYGCANICKFNAISMKADSEGFCIRILIKNCVDIAALVKRFVQY